MFVNNYTFLLHNMDSKKHITRIRKLIEDKSLSFIVGAGFSRNMSDKFPMWGELLRPMLYTMYGIDEGDEAACRQKINEKGYLGVASEYVRREGFHEAIDVYIEKYMPKIRLVEQKEGMCYEVMLGDKKVGVADVECHRKLINLGVKHIFTFNYDNCLDVIGGTEQASERLEEIRKLNHNISRLEEAIGHYDGYVVWEPVVREADMKSVGMLGKVDYEAFNREIIRQFRELIHEAELSQDNNREAFCRNVEKLKECLTRLMYERRVMKSQRSESYQLVTDSHMLSLTDDMKNIYKLHGSMRLNEEDAYGFDGDKHCQYIITQEDYSDYPTKHEPFVNLMKISLLKGAFCLIGFSGDDPNFLSWISWVKNVLEQSPELVDELQQPDNVRFFYIHVDTQELSAEKKLLLRNHYIQYVNLREMYPEVTSYKGLISAFLSDIEPEGWIFEKLREAWFRIYEHLYRVSYRKGELNWDSIEKDIEFVYQNVWKERIAQQTGLEYYYRNSIADAIGRFYEHERMPELALCLLCACGEQNVGYLPASALLQLNEMVQDADGGLKQRVGRLMRREEVMRQRWSMEKDEQVNDLLIWDRLLKLDFGGAKQLLDDWKPTKGIDKLKRAQFISLFEEEKNEVWRELLLSETYDTIQDYVNALEIVPGIRSAFVDKRGEGLVCDWDVRDIKKKLMADTPYLTNYREVIKLLMNALAARDRLDEYGNHVSEYRVDSSSSMDYQSSAKALHVLFELCIVLYVRHGILFAENTWGTICEQLYEEYPYPCLFYSLQYGGSAKLLKRISQKYLYSKKLKDELPVMVRQMMEALMQQECPLQYKEAIYKSLPVLLKGVDASVWEEDFMHYYRTPQERRYNDFNFQHEVFYDFVMTGLRYMKRSDFKLEVIASTLEKDTVFDNYDNCVVIEAMYGLTKEQLAEYPESVRRIRLRLRGMSENITSPSQIYVLMNLEVLMEVEQLGAAFMKVDDELIQNDATSTEALSNYAAKYPPLQARLKPIVLGSRYVWNTGISDDGKSIAGGEECLDMSSICKMLTLTEEDYQQLFEKLKKALAGIEGQLAKEKHEWLMIFCSRWKNIVKDMQRFLSEHGTVLSVSDDYEEVLKRVKNVLERLFSVDEINVLDMLIADKQTDSAIGLLVDAAEAELAEEFMRNHETEYVFIAHKLIDRSSLYLNSCMKHFSWVVRTYHEQMSRSLFMPLLGAMLKSYKSYFDSSETIWDLAHAEKDVLEQGLVVIYSVYRQWGGTDDFWENYTPRYHC